MFDLLATPRRRRFLFAALYLSEGAPIGFIWWALPTLLAEAGVPRETNTSLTAVATLVWTLKFLWAPLVDVVRGPRWTLRCWILAAQAVMVVTLVPLAWIDLAVDLRLLLVLLVAHALAASTQDAAIDALCISVTSHDERGRINGWMQAGMLLGRSALGGGALILESQWGQAALVALLASVTGLTMVLVVLAREPVGAEPASGRARERLAAFVGAVKVAARGRNLWVGLAFALLAGAAFEAAAGILGPLLSDRGFSQEQVGWLRLVPLPAAMIAGSLAGGWLADRLGHRRAVVLGQGMILLFVAMLAYVQGLQQSTGYFEQQMIAALVGLHLGIGLLTAASYALLMDITAPAVAATQFTAFMSATNGCEAWSIWSVGKLASWRGYGPALLAMGIPAIAGTALVLLLRRRPASHSGAAGDTG